MNLELNEVLARNKDSFGLVIGLDYRNERTVVFDLSEDNKKLSKIDLGNPQEFENYLLEILKRQDAEIGIGKYAEDRTIYKHSKLFGKERTVHLGVDLWVKAGIPVFAPLNGKVHSFADNNQDGDYGPTIIIEHTLEGCEFYTLYGHLSRNSLQCLQKGKEVKKGQLIGYIGNYPENGNWPPHLHFEIITDMLGREGDFFGVASQDEQGYYLNLCPNPNLILGISVLD
ncbi:MAG: peptidoglycan DD-metalloendopeptidase family protein [Nanoarchaeota archaeon]|nr:peptidoglycan DD-metalloendopeptidase family protein [Nanoarchaeota archaeon]